MRNVFIVLLNSSFYGPSEKIETHPPSTLQPCNNCSTHTFLFVFKKLLAPPPLKREGRDYVFYTRDYKGEKL